MQIRPSAWLLAWSLTRVLLVVMSMLPQFALALDPTYSLAQYQHTTWTEREGAPTNVLGIAQTSDGYLWIASARGLFRFDGFDFESVTELGGVSLAAESVSALLGGGSGELFLSLGPRRGTAVFKEGRLTKFPDCTLGDSTAHDGQHSWVLCNKRPARLVDDRMEFVGTARGMPDVDTLMLGSDSHGTIWATTETSVMSLQRGARTFQSFALPLPALQVPAPDGALLSIARDGLSVTSLPPGRPAESQRLSPRSFDDARFDRDGGLWAFDARGLVHVGDFAHLRRHPDGNAMTADVMTHRTGLSSDTISVLFEDHQGAVWIGTPAGLERFRDNPLRPVRLAGRNLAFSIAAGRSGEIWAGNFTGKLMRVSGNSVQEYDQIGPGISCIARDLDGSIWVAAGSEDLWHLDEGEVVGVLKVPLDIHGSMITSITRMPSGELWIGSTINGTIGMYANGHWTKPGGRDGLPERWNSRTVLADSEGRVWSSAKRSQILMLHHGRTTLFTPNEGLDAGDIFAIVQRGANIWVGGSRGVAFLDGARFRMLNMTTEDAFANVNGLLEAANGDLWVHEYDTVKRVSSADLASARADPAYRPGAGRFTSLDGLYGASPLSAARATIAEGSDGLIWFSTSEGVMSIDPSRGRQDTRVPKVLINSLVVDRAAHDVVDSFALGHQTRSIRFTYSALSPEAPERVKFRYRLDGLDTDWFEAGSRRAVTYTSLPAGDYRFRIASSNVAGASVDNEASLRFRVEPVWFESTGFRVLYVALGLCMVWLIYRAMLERATRKATWQMRLRQAERDIIARDLHDTLLQGIYGLTWKLQTIANGLPPQDAARTKLERALDNAEVLISESRMRVLVLRENRRSEGSLAQALDKVASRVATAHACSFELKVSGTEVAIRELAQVDICDIAREAFINAISHGQATSIQISIAFTPDTLTVDIEDNGCGIDEEFVRAGRPGHWGLAGMQERARELGGSLHISGAADKGTVVSLALRGARVYRKSRPLLGIRTRIAGLTRYAADIGRRFL